MIYIRLTFFIFLIFPILTQAKDVKPTNQQLITPFLATVIMGQGQNNQPTFYALNEKGQVNEVSTSYINSAISVSIETAKNAICKLNKLPEQVTVSVGLFSATWETKKFCE